jgi:preprotein translocase subunit SecF
MATPNPSAAGAPLALSIVAGAVIGSMAHQALIGAAIGVVLGIAIAVGVWLWDRKKIGH